MNQKKVLSVVTAITGHKVTICEPEIIHAIEKHFQIPKIKLLEIVEMVLIDPTVVFIEESKSESQIKSYHIFYKLETKSYLVVIVKLLPEGTFFSTIYPTGNTIRNIHKNLKKVRYGKKR